MVRLQIPGARLAAQVGSQEQGDSSNGADASTTAAPTSTSSLLAPPSTARRMANGISNFAKRATGRKRGSPSSTSPEPPRGTKRRASLDGGEPRTLRVDRFGADVASADPNLSPSAVPQADQAGQGPSDMGAGTASLRRGGNEGDEEMNDVELENENVVEGCEFDMRMTLCLLRGVMGVCCAAKIPNPVVWLSLQR